MEQEPKQKIDPVEYFQSRRALQQERLRKEAFVLAEAEAKRLRKANRRLHLVK
jgi:hypothetical protein